MVDKLNTSHHQNILGTLCRICGSKIILNSSYKTAKTVQEYSNVIYSVYNIDIENEAVDVFPKLLCSKCRRNLDRYKNKLTDHKTAYHFEKHSDPCSLCGHRSAYTKQQDACTRHLRVFDDAFSRFNFCRYYDSSTVKRTYIFPVKIDNIMTCKFTIVIKENFQWTLQLFNRFVDENNIYLNGIPKVLDDDNISDFVSKVSNLKVCNGINNFSDVINAKLEIRQPFLDKSESIIGILENNAYVPLIKSNFSNVRHKDCLSFCKSGHLCSSCSDYQAVLRKVRSRMKQSMGDITHKRVSDDSHTNIKYLSREELEERLINTQKKKKESLRKIANLSVKINKLIETNGVKAQKSQHELFASIIQTNNLEFEEDSPQWLLWQQQKEQASKRNSKGMRWHPLIIRWCLSIFHTSPAAYKQLASKKLQFINLPHINTLKKFTKFTTPTSGFNPDILERLIEDSNLASLEDFQKNVVLIFDEMKIKSDLVYSRSTGKLIGFTELGDINEEFRVFEKKKENSDNPFEREFSTYVQVYMVRGIFTNLQYPFAYFGSLGFTAAQLYPCTIEATVVLEDLGFKVRAFTCDGASPNRKFFTILYVENGDTYWTYNPRDCSRKIYFISDVPHLLKTTRNCFENSLWNRATRNMHFQGQDISWLHIIDVYEWDLGLHRAAPGLRMLHKLKEEHIKLSPRLRMRVKLAAQVLSSTTANALRHQDLHNTKSTINFIKMFDQVFDCLNVSKFNKNVKGKKELSPYFDANDWRFRFLEHDFLELYLDRWEEEANTTVGLTLEEKNRLLLSKQTIHGWHITVKSFVELAKLLLQLPGVKFLLSEKFSQDPLEEHFSRHRRRGGASENPTLYAVGNQELTLNVMRSELISDLRGNTRGRGVDKPELDIHDLRQLPKKRKRDDDTP